MLTKRDLMLIKETLRDEFVTKDEFRELKSELRDDIVTFKDQILTEIQNLRVDVAVLTGYRDMIEDHETRIGTLEKQILA